MKDVDLCVITHLPAFYKVKLFNELAKHCRLFVIFIAKQSAIRAPSFTHAPIAFDHVFLSDAAFEVRPRLSSLWKLHACLRQLRYARLLVSGWDMLEFWMAVTYSPRQKNTVIVESTHYSGGGIRAARALKQGFLMRVKDAIVSGTHQEAYVRALGLKGACIHSQGVGFPYPPRETAPFKSRAQRFLYSGRFSPEKNISLLIEAFRDLSEVSLTLVGAGIPPAPLPAHIQCQPARAPELLSPLYASHDALILPSKAEAWGLVVQEALLHHLPVIVSDHVGCAASVVEKFNVGRVFPHQNVQACQAAIQSMTQSHVYVPCQQAAAAYSYQDVCTPQTQAYLSVLSE